MPVRTAGALVFLLLMIEQHNTFSFWNGYQINPKICQNILYSHCFMSQNTCFSFLNSGTAHHFLFLPKSWMGDPLGWWKNKRLEYPTLTRLVRKFLCVPATSTQAERVFSWMGWLLNKRRLCLSGESVNMQLFLKDNL